jgi:hypothetical protein
MDLAHSYAKIIKQEKQEDGTLLVYGKATDDALDIDQQICDAGWLDRAMPEWFKTGGNIREQHSNIAAGVAKELDSKADGHYISALVVDPVSIKKVEAGVLKGFSIGIRSPRIVRDTKAANGRIIDGQIVEISLVDRPANPNAKLMLAKCDNELDLIKVEEYAETENIEKHGDHDQSDHNPSGGGGSDSKTDARIEGDRTANNVSTAISDIRDELGDIEDELRDAGDNESAGAVSEALDTLNDAGGVLDGVENQTEKEFTANLEDTLKDLEVSYERIGEVNHPDAERIQNDIQDLVDEVEGFLDGYYGRGEDKSVTTTRQKERAMARTKKVTKSVHDKDKAAAEKPSKEDLMKQYKEAKKALEDISAMCKEAGIEIEIDDEDEEKELKPVGESAEEETEEGSKPEAAEEEVEEAEGKKPLDKSDTTKSLDTIIPRIDVDGNDVADDGTDKDSSDDEDLSNKTIAAIIEKAVKSAKDAITNEVVSYQEEINKLNAELATAKTKAVAGGPKRSAIKPAVIAELGDLLQKAAEYRAKSAVTDDKDLARGYKELASDFEAKALLIQASK